MAKKKLGYVYILTNPSLRGRPVKIGQTHQAPTLRAKNLNTGAPDPFETFAFLRSERYAEVERFLHAFLTRLTKTRLRADREFYRLKPADALAALEMVADLVGECDVVPVADVRRKFPDGAVYVLSGSGARAVGVKHGDAFTVLAGSRLGPCSPRFAGKYRDSRRALERSGIVGKDGVLLKDADFPGSLSVSASVVMGHQANGCKEWKPI